MTQLVEFRLLQVVLCHVGDERRTVGLVHFDGVTLRRAVRHGRLTEGDNERAFRDTVDAIMAREAKPGTTLDEVWPVREGRGAGLEWRPRQASVTSDPGAHFDELCRTLRLGGGLHTLATLAPLAVALEALREIASLAKRCDEGDCEYADDAPNGHHRIATHMTTLFGVPVYLCDIHAPIRAASHRKAESKGCGAQPEVKPYVEQNEAITIALAALAKIEGDTAAAQERA